MKKLNETEKAILLYLMKQKKSITCNYQITQNEKLRTKFECDEIINAAENLKNEGIIKFNNGSNGRIATAEIFKELKKLFRYRLVFNSVKNWCNKLLLFLWKHFFIAILTSIAAFLIGGYIGKLGL